MMSISKWIFAGAIFAGAIFASVVAGSASAQYRQIEQPAYERLISDKRFEVRDYQPMIVAEVTHSGDRRRANRASFRRLAAYIFAQDRPRGGERIAMTAPVMQERVDQNERIAMTSPVLQEATGETEWRMRFVMPSRFTMATLPEPPADITLTEVPARRMASVRFDGYGSEADLMIMEAMLRQWMEEQGLSAMGDVEYAFYDDPSVPGPRRRNEVLIEIASN